MTEKQMQPNADDVISDLSNQIAKLTGDNAMLRSLIKQYQDKYNEAENAK